MTQENSRKHPSRREGVILGILVGLCLAITGLYYLFKHWGADSIPYITSSILLYTLAILNLTLILAIVFILLRNLIKLFMEARRKIICVMLCFCKRM